ncbi:MAG: polysaccharide export protein [Methylobacter sp.]|nr:polysaccharide export protein [Methylobacter sp.]
MNHLIATILFFWIFAVSAYADSEPLVVTKAVEPKNIVNPSSAPQPISSVKEQLPDDSNYLLSPGDLLDITVWKEEGLQQQQILVAPDGNITFPFAGTIMAAGKPISLLQETIAGKMSAYIADPVINIKLLQNNGNSIFVVGKVNKPGQFPVNRRIDIMQAISLAGGLTVFADDDSIKVLRRVGKEVKVFSFDYSDVVDGQHLEQNIILEAGDTVTVP